VQIFNKRQIHIRPHFVFVLATNFGKGVILRCDRNCRPGEKKEFSFYSINTEQLFRVTDYCVPVLQPKLTEEAGQKLIDHYVSMRKIGAGRGQVSLPSNSVCSFSLLFMRKFKTLCMETVISDFDMLIFRTCSLRSISTAVYLNFLLNAISLKWNESQPTHLIRT
jgi:hypothetical protein